jgi:hypothetical protein
VLSEQDVYYVDGISWRLRESAVASYGGDWRRGIFLGEAEE